MIVLIPLGGTGERFKKHNYSNPKALVNIFGKPILYYLIDCLNASNVDFVYIPYNKEYTQFRLEDKLTKDYPNIKFRFYPLPYNTGGAAETINISLKQLTCEDKPILCLDADNFYTVDIVKLWNSENKVITVNSSNENPIYSYVQMENDRITDIVEKRKISNYACTGAYGFSSYKQLLKYTQVVLDNDIRQNNEYYTSNVIKEMIKDDVKFGMSSIDIGTWHCLGTPTQVKFFYNNHPKISSLDNSQKIKNLRVCFDLDNTLVTFPAIKDDYTTVEPIEHNINFLRYLKSFGHTIIIYSARRMRTHKGNVGKVACDVGKLTFETLEKFDIPFDEIYFGKPYADFYIDDLAVNCFDDLEKSLGFYMDTVKPRDFNNLSEANIELFRKQSDDLSGEIYYYNNIPKEIKDLFPVMMSFDEVGYKSFTVEKIIGLTVTNLFLSELLQPSTLINIMNSIKRIQNCSVINDNDIDIYENYGKKLESRYNSYDYSRFSGSESVCISLREDLKKYQESKRGKLTVIHGDCVMTNILINNLEKIKFIDMRGKVGSTLTICGDWLYDWAKLYQSLIGYDKILQGKNVSEKYENELLETFKEYFITSYSPEDFENLKMITKSFLFTLIPLHNNSKCLKYYDLLTHSNHLNYNLCN